MRRIDHFGIKGTITLLTGARIGGSDDVLQIGGTDLTCIKDPASGKPYIPGSSLKGRMRAELERTLGKAHGKEPCGCAGLDCPICRVFGPHKRANHELGPTRIKIWDARLLSDSFVLENKTESVNRRDTGAAEHPRTLERVAPGAKFELHVEFSVYDIDKDFKYSDPDNKEVTGKDALLEVINHALDLLEGAGIGAGTGKGYGQIKVEPGPAVRTKRRRLIPPMS